MRYLSFILAFFVLTTVIVAQVSPCAKFSTARKQFKTASPAVRANTMKAHILVLQRNPSLTQEQRTYLNEALNKISPLLYVDSPIGQAERNKMESFNALGETLFLPTKDAPSALSSLSDEAQNYLAINSSFTPQYRNASFIFTPDCECKFGTMCSERITCNGGGNCNSSYLGCGPWWTQPCTSLCNLCSTGDCILTE